MFFFLILNCFFVAGPALYASPPIIFENTSTGFPTQNQSTDQEELSRFSNEQEQRQADPITVRNKRSHLLLVTRAGGKGQKDVFCWQSNKTPISKPSCLIRPAYYSFLSLYHLF